MKKYSMFLKTVMLIFVTILGIPTCFAGDNKSNNVIVEMENEDPLGVWLYTAEGTSPEYRTGVLFIREENGKHVIEVQLETGTLTGQDVEVDKDTIKFNMNVEGLERISVVLAVNGNKISGETYSTEGTYKISGYRKMPPQ